MVRELMEHDAAMESRAVERYLLKEMAPAERDSFEEHYFSCEECAEDVRQAAAFIANAKATWRLQETRREPSRDRSTARRPWFGWLQLAWGPALATVLLAVTGYQSLVTLPALQRAAGEAREPRQVAAFVLRADSRGAAKTIEAGASQPLLLTLDLNPQQPFAKYVAEIQSSSGAVVSTIPVNAPPPEEPLNLYVPSLNLPPGQYTLVIRGDTGAQPGPEAGRYRFDLQRK